MSSLPGLTAAQDQMMDLLVARTRLGEPFWPISNELRRTANILEAKGYIVIHHGHVEGTFRAELTPAALKEFIVDSSYVPPIKLEAREEIAQLLEKLGGDPTTIRMIRTAAYGGKK